MWVLKWLHSATVVYFRHISVANYSMSPNPKPYVPDTTSGDADIRQLASDKERVWMSVVQHSTVRIRGVVSQLAVRVFIVCTCDVFKSGSVGVLIIL
jgi:hypothetical protein